MAISQQAAGAISSQLTQQEEKYQLQLDRPLAILWLIYCYFAVSHSQEAHLQIQGLMRVWYTKDSEMADFLYRWNTALMRMHTRLDNENLCDLFVGQIRKSQTLRHVMDLWDDMDPIDPERSYTWHHARVERHSKREFPS